MPDEQNDMEIRASGRNDIQALLHLYDQLNPNDPELTITEAERIWQQLRKLSGSDVFIGIVDEVLVATCTLVVIPNLTRGGLPYGLIENVITHVDYRKKGYGKAIIKEAISTAWRHSCYKIMLLSGSKDPATLKFYEGVGFEQNKTGFQIRRLPVRES